MAQTLKFLMGREYKGQVNTNNSCYYKKNGILFLINCGKGVVDAMKRTRVLTDIKQVYVVITNSSKEHLADLKKFFFVLKQAKIKPIIIESISVNKKLLKRMGINEGDDFAFLEPLSNNIKWINFLATPHSNKNFSCPIEMLLDGKKIFYGGDTGLVPFAIKGYDEYYFDFSDKQSEYFLDVAKVKMLVQKNKIRKQQLWLVHLQNLQALQLAEKIGMQVAEEEKAKLVKPKRKAKTKIVEK